MKIGAAIMAVIAAICNFCSCAVKDPAQMTVRDYKPELKGGNILP